MSNQVDLMSFGRAPKKQAASPKKVKKPRRILWGADQPFRLPALMTLFQLLVILRFYIDSARAFELETLLPFAALITMQWVYYSIVVRVLKRRTLELESVAFLLCTVGITVLSTVSLSAVYTQLAAMAMGLVLFNVLLWFMRDPARVMKYKVYIGAAAVLLFAANLLFGSVISGSKNWIQIGPLSIQPSELVKIAFVIMGSSTLDRLLLNRHLTWFILFFGVCIGSLVLMGDFGTALIFFFTFIVISILRSGDMRTLILICAGAVLGVLIVLYFKPYIARRFEAWRHVWEFADTTGYQQTRVLIGAASGGLFGLGIGCGYLRYVAASTTDLIFGMIAEEWGLVFAFVILAVYAGIAAVAVRFSKRSRSTLYSIAACAAAGMMLFQVCLNVFGITDILPLTGVTLPFVSRGGSSMLSSWGLLALIKSADERLYLEGRKPLEKV